MRIANFLTIYIPANFWLYNKKLQGISSFSQCFRVIWKLFVKILFAWKGATFPPLRVIMRPESFEINKTDARQICIVLLSKCVHSEGGLNFSMHP